MIDIERRNTILRLLEEKHSVKVSELSQILYIGEATIRRDLTKLEQSGYLKRIHGGAVSLDQVDREIPADIRKIENADKKAIIADLAANLIQSGNTISVDSSTTCLALAMVPHNFTRYCVQSAERSIKPYSINALRMDG